MKAPPVRYVRASTLDDVFRLQRESDGTAKLLAGGQSLLAALAFRLSTPDLLIDITRIADLQGITVLPGGGVRVGALTTHRELGAHAVVQRKVPLLAQAVPLIAHAAIRNRGTIGGSLAYADPAAELPACCVALEAVIAVVGPRGERRINAADFFTGLFETALADDELILAIEVPPATPDHRSTILELSRRSGDYAMAGVAACAWGKAGQTRDLRLVFFGVGACPVVAHRATAALGPLPWTPDVIAAAQACLELDLDPPADQHGGPEMKRHLAGILLARALAALDPARKATAA